MLAPPPPTLPAPLQGLRSCMGAGTTSTSWTSGPTTRPTPSTRQAAGAAASVLAAVLAHSCSCAVFLAPPPCTTGWAASERR